MVKVLLKYKFILKRDIKNLKGDDGKAIKHYESTERPPR